MMDMEDRRRFFIIGSAILEVVTPVFSTRLEQEYTKRGYGSLQSFLDTQPVVHVLFHLRHRYAKCCSDRSNCSYKSGLPLTYNQWDILYMEHSHGQRHVCHCLFKGKPARTGDLDITLSGLILLNCCNVSPADATAIQTLRKFKNDYLSHNTKGSITETVYKNLWFNLTKYVLQLDPNKEDDLIRIERRPLDEPLCNKYQTVLLDVFTKLDEVHMSIQKVLTFQQYFQTTVEDIRNKLSLQQVLDEGNLGDKLGNLIFTVDQEINLSLHLERNLAVKGGVLLDDGKIVLTLLWNKELLICSNLFNVVHTDRVKMQDHPWSVASLSQTTVAVTLPWAESVVIIDIQSKTTKKTIPIGCMCMGISCKDNKIFVACLGIGLKVMDNSGHLKLTVHTNERKCWGVYVTNTRIVYSVMKFKALFSCNYYGDDEVVLKLPSFPKRITALIDSSLYITCHNGVLLHVAADGRRYERVTIDGLETVKDPWLVNYNIVQNKLLIADVPGKIKICRELNKNKQ